MDALTEAGFKKDNEVITFNIETIARVDLPEGLKISRETIHIPQTSGGVKLDTEEKRNRYVEDKIRESSSDFALKPLRNQVCAISLKVDNDDVATMTGNNEVLLLNFFSDFIKSQKGHSTRLVGFNSKSFDLHVLAVAFAKNGLEFPIVDYNAHMSKYYENYHCDVRNVLTNYNSMEKGTLGDWCEAFGIPRPYGRGHMVENWFIGGEWDEIARHCSDNVNCTYELFKRLRTLV